MSQSRNLPHHYLMNVMILQFTHNSSDILFTLQQSDCDNPLCKNQAVFSFNYIYIINLDIDHGSTMLHVTPNRRQHSVEITPPPPPSNDLHNLIEAIHTSL